MASKESGVSRGEAQLQLWYEKLYFMHIFSQNKTFIISEFKLHKQTGVYKDSLSRQGHSQQCATVTKQPPEHWFNWF